MKHKRPKEFWRMPDGSYTDNVVKQCRAWHKIGKLLKKEFGFTMIGFNPGFALKTRNGEYLDISVETANTLLERIDRK